jgi:hypothetical protein
MPPIRPSNDAPMTEFAGTGYRQSRVRGLAASPLLLPVVVFGSLALIALLFIGYVLWPRWPGAAVAPDAPAFPITVAGVVFNVPAAAVRVAVQRRPGPHERIDLMFQWPSLEPPDPSAKPAVPTQGALPAPGAALERLFVTIANAGETLPPAERARTIYPRYTNADAGPGPAGLTVLPFRDGTPFQGEDLIYDNGSKFLVRCTRNGAGLTPGTCLYEQRIEKADVIARFPRDWLGDWRSVADKIDKLIAGLRPRS